MNRMTTTTARNPTQRAFDDWRTTWAARSGDSSTERGAGGGRAGPPGENPTRAGGGRRREALDRCRLARWPGHGETLLGLQLGARAVLGGVGHRAWAIGCVIRCNPSASVAG